MRITQKAVAQTALLGLNRNLTELGKLQQQLTSGKVVSKPSDSPTGVNRAMQIRQDQAAVTQQARNISDAQGWLDTTDTTLRTMSAQVQRVRDLTVQASNEGALSESGRSAVTTELREIRKSLIGLANTSVDGRPLFGGVTTGDRAYADDGSYVGVGGADGIPVVPTTRRIADGEDVRIDVTGSEAFGDPAGVDLFALVGKIADDVDGDPAALGGDLEALDASLKRLLTGLSTIGARAARVESAAQTNSDVQLSLSRQLADVEDVDLPKTIMQLQFQQTGYQAALSATSQVIQPSLVDFLR
ncbi:flagellar hook-associated protein 3 FlgL [Geodermatophilus telluris]|uniref:Flagellar hook-associated protein 3 FlgL n=1 Tax=Geodermatophilus telluris TaxID=1190417 RepID=A0A1G6M9X4_9ACTN|nr:flagellar hook-associated protein FlgL [Geodermatophilus telluris]SDC51776.1 flagellar hook-associated protein 3 FlgL [Geodermatophilus telluris]